MSDFHAISANTAQGTPQSLGDYRGRLLLVVNVASQCGFTPQYEGLETLYRKYKDRGFVVLAFPCNQFGEQEPGTEAQILDFCRTTYDVSFPVFQKVEVKGPGAHPLYRHLTAARPGLLGSEAIKWNFTKFLVGADGQVLKRYAPTTTPSAIEADIVANLPAASAAGGDAPS